MQIFLTVFTLFNLCAVAAAWNGIMNVDVMYGVKGWASKRLYTISIVACWGLLLTGLWASAAGWAFAPEGAPLVLLPVCWLMLCGIVFAVVDFIEDGVFDFGRGAPIPKS